LESGACIKSARCCSRAQVIEIGSICEEKEVYQEKDENNEYEEENVLYESIGETVKPASVICIDDISHDPLYESIEDKNIDDKQPSDFSDEDHLYYDFSEKLCSPSSVESPPSPDYVDIMPELKRKGNAKHLIKQFQKLSHEGGNTYSLKLENMEKVVPVSSAVCNTNQYHNILSCRLIHCCLRP